MVRVRVGIDGVQCVCDPGRVHHAAKNQVAAQVPLVRLGWRQRAVGRREQRRVRWRRVALEPGVLAVRLQRRPAHTKIFVAGTATTLRRSQQRRCVSPALAPTDHRLLCRAQVTQPRRRLLLLLMPPLCRRGVRAPHAAVQVLRHQQRVGVAREGEGERRRRDDEVARLCVAQSVRGY